MIILSEKMNENTIALLQLIIDALAAIATPVAIVVAIREFKRKFSINVKVNNNSIVEIYLINECSHALLITKLKINGNDYDIDCITLTPSNIEKIEITTQSIIPYTSNKKHIKITAISSNNIKSKGKINRNEIEI